MKVYVITSGEYSSYGICAVTLDKEQAELLKTRYSDTWNEACIEKYDTDDYKIEVSDDYIPLWNVEFRNGEIVRCYKIFYERISHGTVYASEWSREVNVFVKAKDKEYAKKIAKDIYMKWLAEQNNL